MSQTYKDPAKEFALMYRELEAKSQLLTGALLRILALSEAGDERGHIANEALQGRVARTSGDTTEEAAA